MHYDYYTHFIFLQVEDTYSHSFIKPAKENLFSAFVTLITPLLTKK
jgi:hypothetical protein